ncbi:MAG: hypothetical protein PHQ34_00205 [Methanothrix sp.]|nr:hypothetical protein [Methanothrix sp.]
MRALMVSGGQIFSEQWASRSPSSSSNVPYPRIGSRLRHVGLGLNGDVVTTGWMAWQAIVHGGRRPVGPSVRKC